MSERGFWGWGCPSYINYLLGMCPPNNYLARAGEDCPSDTFEGMYVVRTADKNPFALGKWTDLSQPIFKVPFRRRDPFLNMIDDHGKIDGQFNNLNSVRRQGLMLFKQLFGQLRNVTIDTIERKENGRQAFAASWRKEFYDSSGFPIKTTTRRPRTNSTTRKTGMTKKRIPEVLSLNGPANR